MKTRKNGPTKKVQDNTAHNTLISILLDCSGSMSDLVSDVIGGVNTMIKEQADLKARKSLMISKFDGNYEVVRPIADPKNMDPISSDEYFARGSTALLDSVGRNIADMKAKIREASTTSSPYTRALLVIFTDGQENSSREFSKANINSMISELRSSGFWEFNFVGTNQDAITEAGNLGIPMLNAAFFSNNTKGVRSSLRGVGQSITAYAWGASNNLSSQNYCTEGEDIPIGNATSATTDSQ